MIISCTRCHARYNVFVTYSIVYSISTSLDLVLVSGRVDRDLERASLTSCCKTSSYVGGSSPASVSCPLTSRSKTMFLSKSVSGTSAISDPSTPTELPRSDVDRTADNDRAVCPGAGLGE